MKDESFRDSVIQSDMSVADGMPLIWLARLLEIPLPERVAGASMFDSLRVDPTSKIKVYFFGGPPGIAEKACQRLNENGGEFKCVGHMSPGFGTIEEMSSDSIIEHINSSEADFLVVALGAKKGNAWIQSNFFRLTVPVVSHLGAVINFIAGSVSRSPTWMQHVGLEWLWRIKEEPYLWRRYFSHGVALIPLLLFNVLPYAWYVYRHRELLGDVSNTHVSIEIHAGVAEIKLQGVCVENNLEPIRSALKCVVKYGLDIKLNMAEVRSVDNALIGLLMILFGHQQLLGKSLSVVGVTAIVRKIFIWNCAEFLLRDEE
jgi:N-acetylglucosaminyldiphosphoundecaprenol N-acetyl-beta-D-mannosaminyltransferase